MNCLIEFLLVALIWRNVRAEYGASCISPDNLSGKCVPVYSCSNINTRLTFQSNCGIFDDVQHVCCAENEIQYNSKVLDELEKLKCGEFVLQYIGNGKEVRPWSRPWMALLGYNRIDNEVFNCGGTLISDRHVLTAAHCVKGLEEDLKIVRLGEHNIAEKTDCVKPNRFRTICNDATDVGIDKIFVHEGYQFGSTYYDIALLRLSNPVPINKFILPICLPITKKLQNAVDTIPTFFVTGWGVTETGTRSDVLLEARDSQICIGGNDNKESCKGDSGGPLQGIGIVKTAIPNFTPRRMVQFGIVSFGESQCGKHGLFGLYTNVGHYIQWITDKMAT